MFGEGSIRVSGGAHPVITDRPYIVGRYRCYCIELVIVRPPVGAWHNAPCGSVPMQDKRLLIKDDCIAYSPYVVCRHSCNAKQAKVQAGLGMHDGPSRRPA